MPSDPAEVAQALTEVAARYVDRLLTVAGPRIIVIDDVHWLDPSSEVMVELIVEATRERPLIVLAGARPSRVPTWAANPGVERLDLQGLAEPETARLATLIARAAVEADGVRSIHQRTGRQSAVHRRDGPRVPRGRDARMARRPGRADRDRAAAHAGHASGRPRRAHRCPGAGRARGARRRLDHRHHASGQLWSSSCSATRCHRATLDHLAEAALIARGDDEEWRFAHALIREAAYAGLLATRRRALHARLADHLEREPRAAALGQIAGPPRGRRATSRARSRCCARPANRRSRSGPRPRRPRSGDRPRTWVRPSDPAAARDRTANVRARRESADGRRRHRAPGPV